MTARFASLIGRRALDARMVLPLVWPHHVRVHGLQRVSVSVSVSVGVSASASASASASVSVAATCPFSAAVSGRLDLVERHFALVS